METIGDTKEKFTGYREMVRLRASELEQQNINVRKLDAKEEEKLENLRSIEVLDFKRGQHQIIAVLRQMIGGASDPLLHIDDTICNIADIHGFVYPAVEIIPLKVHRSALVGQNHVHHKIPKLLAVVIGHAFLKITGIEGINVRPYIVHRSKNAV